MKMKSNIFELEYKQLLMRCLLKGPLSANRTEEKTYKLFNQSINIDLDNGFPIITGKKIFFDKAQAEFKWIYNGDTSLEFLHENGIKWWDSFAKNGELGKIYGHQVRTFNGEFDQIEYCINEIKNNSRRAVITLWNPSEFEEQSLPCCYTHFTFVKTGGSLNMAMDFRSSDLFLGLPYDIVVGALFLIEIAKETNLKPQILGINLKDAHIYECHKRQVLEYIKNPNFRLPKYKDGKLINYKHGKLIKAKLVL